MPNTLQAAIFIDAEHYVKVKCMVAMPPPPVPAAAGPVVGE